MVPILMAIDLIAPAVLLVLLRRWTGRWHRAVPVWVIATPLGAFLLTGGVTWLEAYLTWNDKQTNIGPDGVGMSYPDYLATTFFVCGVYGARFAARGSVNRND